MDRLNIIQLQPAGPNAVISYNTINTLKGGQYQIKLADGTNIWMNAASSIRFPTVFSDLKEKLK